MTNVIDVLLAIAKKTLPEGDIEIRFLEWMQENAHDLGAGCRKLGIEPPKEGENLVHRLHDLVIPMLEGKE